MMIGYDIYDRFTIEHFPLRQKNGLTTSFFFARDSTFAINQDHVCFLIVRIHFNCGILSFS
jgi:hypothetical protein